MKKWIIAVLLMVAPWLRAQNTTLTGTIAGPSGTGLNGVLQLQLVMPGAATIVAGCGGPLYILPQQITINVSNGNLVSPPNVWGADCLSPALIPYHVVIRDTNGNQIVNDYWLIQGSTFNVGTAYSANPSGTNIVFTFPMTRLSYFSSLATACSTVAAAGGTLYVDEAISPPAGFTCAANIWVAQGGVITLSGTANVFSSPFIYAPYGQWLVGSVSNIASFAALKAVPAEWFGADRTGINDSTNALQAAVASAIQSGSFGNFPNVSLQAGNYSFGVPGGGAIGTLILAIAPAGAGFRTPKLIGAGKVNTTLNWKGPATQPAIAINGHNGGLQGFTLNDLSSGWTAGVIEIENGGTFNGQSWAGGSSANNFDDVSVNCEFQPGDGFIIGGIGELSGQADQSAFYNIEVSNCGSGAGYVFAGNNTLDETLFNNAMGRNWYGVVDYNGPMAVYAREFDHVALAFMASSGANIKISGVRGEEVVKWVGGPGNGAAGAVTLENSILNAHFVTSPIGTVSISKAGGSTTITPAYNLPIVCTGSNSSASCSPTSLTEPTNHIITFTTNECFAGSTQGPGVGPVTYIVSNPTSGYMAKTKISYPYMDQSCTFAFGSAAFTETSSGDNFVEWGNATATITGSPSTSVTFSADAFVNGDVVSIAGAGSGGPLVATLSGCVPSATTESCITSIASATNVAGAVVAPGNQEAWHVTLDWPSAGGSYSVIAANMPDHASTLTSPVVGNTNGRQTWTNDSWAASGIVDPTNHTVFTCNGNIHGNWYNQNVSSTKMLDCPGDNLAAINLTNGSTATTQSFGDNTANLATDSFVQNAINAPPASLYGGFGPYLNGADSSNDLSNTSYWIAIPTHPTPTITGNAAADCLTGASTLTKFIIPTLSSGDYSGLTQGTTQNSLLGTTYQASTSGSNWVAVCLKGNSGGEQVAVGITTTIPATSCFTQATFTLTTSAAWYLAPTCTPSSSGSSTALSVRGLTSASTFFAGNFLYQPGVAARVLNPVTSSVPASGSGQVSNGLIVWQLYSSSTIPACVSPLKGSKEFATDGSSTPTLWATYSGGGSTVGPVYCDGSNWRYF